MPQAASNPKSIRLAAPLEFAAPTGDKLAAKFSGTAYSGGRVHSYGCVIDVDSTDVPKRMPLLMEHDRRDIIGVVENGEKAGYKINVAGAVFSDMAGGSAERVAQLSQRGAPYQMSVGLFGYSEEYVHAGQSVTVNGAVHEGPVVVLRNGKVRECSIVTLGADHDTSAQFFSLPEGDAPAKPEPKGITMTLEEQKALEAQVAALTAEKAALLASQAAAAKAARATAVTALFAETGDKPTDEQVASFGAMDEAAFTAVSTVIRAAAAKLKKHSPALFTDTATEGAQGEPNTKAIVLSLPDILAKRRVEAAKAIVA